jgi:phospholipid transport system substrate-binding protein
MSFKITGAAFAAFLAYAPALYAAPATDAASFISNIGQQAVGILQASPDTETRKKAFHTLFSQDFDAPAIGKFVLGRYWRTATPEQQKQYIAVFTDYVVTFYASQFSNYHGQQFKVLGSDASQAGMSTVKSQIISTDGAPPTNIAWQVALEGTAYKITDVSVENLSMAVTKRQEFASVIEQNGGNVQALIDQLKEKAAEG